MNTTETATEVQTGVSTLELPQPTYDHAYLIAKLISWSKPNSKGAEFCSDSIAQEVLDSWVGRQVNIEHDKTKVIGNIRKLAKTELGVESLIEVDRFQAQAHGLSLNDLGRSIHGASCEFTREPAKSSWILRSSDGTIVQKLTAVEAEALGLRRTTRLDPFKYNGLSCSEVCTVESFTGVGLTKSPSDRSASIYQIAASDNAPASSQPRATSTFPMNTAGITGAVSGFIGGKWIRDAQRNPDNNPSLNRRHLSDETISKL